MKPLAQQQSGATLMVGLIILFIITLLGINTMDTAITEVGMVEIEQADNRAFATAEQLINAEVRRTDIFPLTAPGQLPDEPLNQNVSVTDTDGITLGTGSGRTWYTGDSIALGSEAEIFTAYLFESAATTTSGRSGNAVIRYGFYVEGPSP